LAAVREGRYDDAAAGMLRSKWAGQVGERAKRLAALMREG
jgi:lysozyme